MVSSPSTSKNKILKLTKYTIIIIKIKQALNSLPPIPPNNLLRLAYDAAPSHPARLSWLNDSLASLKRARAQIDGGIQQPARRAWPGSMLRSCYVIQEKIPNDRKGTEDKEGKDLSSKMGTDGVIM